MGVLELAKKLNKKYGDDKLAITADITPKYTRVATGAFGFDYPLQGGLPEGRIVTFAGLFHSGKTTAACLAVAAYQRKYPDKICVYIDMEHSLDLQFQARMTGLQLDKMVYMSPTTLTGEQVLDTILEYQQEDDIGIIVLDSISFDKVLENYDSKHLEVIIYGVVGKINNYKENIKYII